MFSSFRCYLAPVYQTMASKIGGGVAFGSVTNTLLF